MILPPAPAQYVRDIWQGILEIVRKADVENLKTNKNIRLQSGVTYYIRQPNGTEVAFSINDSGAWVTPSGGGGGLSDGDKGDITVSGVGTVWTIDPDVVSFAKMQNISAVSRLLGRGSAAGAGDPEEIVLGTNLSMSGTTLNAAAGAGNFGTAVLNFGAFPGATDASVAVTGQAGILAGSVVNAWLRPTASADHTADEHLVESLKVLAGNIVPGTGFTIYGLNTSEISEEPLGWTGANKAGKAGQGTRLYGQWNVAWVWN
jgi:hypothetical protein